MIVTSKGVPVQLPHDTAGKKLKMHILRYFFLIFTSFDFSIYKLQSKR